MSARGRERAGGDGEAEKGLKLMGAQIGWIWMLANLTPLNFCLHRELHRGSYINKVERYNSSRKNILRGNSLFTEESIPKQNVIR